VQSDPINKIDPSGRCEENGDESCWGVYEQIVYLCPECKDLQRDTYDRSGVRLKEESITYLQTILKRVNSGWRPGGRPAASLRKLIRERNDFLVAKVQKGELTDLEAFAQLTEYAASLTPDCDYCFVQGLGAVLTGHSRGAAWQDEISGQLGKDVFDEYSQREAPLLQSGYDCIFQDLGAGRNQPHHYWFYVQVAYEDERVIAHTGNLAHETLLTKEFLTAIRTLNIQEFLNAPGRSFEDWALGIEGIHLGVALRYGTIRPIEVGNYIRSTLSPESAAALKWKQNKSTLEQILKAMEAAGRDMR